MAKTRDIIRFDPIGCKVARPARGEILAARFLWLRPEQGPGQEARKMMTKREKNRDFASKLAQASARGAAEPTLIKIIAIHVLA